MASSSSSLIPSSRYFGSKFEIPLRLYWLTPNWTSAQLCINFANEKLQMHFNQSVFNQEKAMYEHEAISVPDVKYRDNQVMEQRASSFDKKHILKVAVC